MNLGEVIMMMRIMVTAKVMMMMTITHAYGQIADRVYLRHT